MLSSGHDSLYLLNVHVLDICSVHGCDNWSHRESQFQQEWTGPDCMSYYKTESLLTPETFVSCFSLCDFLCTILPYVVI